jgi:hypothetical protein
VVPVTKPYEVTPGCEAIEMRERAVINGKIEGLDFDAGVVAVSSLGRADGDELDAIIGAGTLGHGRLQLIQRTGSLGLEGLRRRRFTEY